LLKVLTEDQVLDLTQEAISEEETTKNHDLAADFEQPMKVFRRAGTPDKTLSTAYEVPKLDISISSCQAIRSAVSTLYNIEDFDLTKIGEGFFSEVFRVSDFLTKV
jgi:hypothetical protein